MRPNALCPATVGSSCVRADSRVASSPRGGADRSLLGIETEYALAGFTSSGEAFPHSTAVLSLMDAARRNLTHLPGPGRYDLFLENASRLYLDHGAHPELATPECTDPLEVVRYTLAGERILRDLATEVERNEPGLDRLCLFKSNVDYGGTGTTWGCHESYLLKSAPASIAEALIPHLVSRVVYTGAGGFDPFSPGITFTLSPRVGHLEHTMSSESTHDRGIFHTKNESLSTRGYHRLHVLCGESLCSERAMWLKLGSTALVVALIDRGLQPGANLKLLSPVEAMKSFVSDPRARQKVATEDGRWLSALAIQRRYLELAEEHLSRSFMPIWARAVCREWRETLELLGRSPGWLSRRLDWAIKLAFYERWIEKRGFTRETLEAWNDILMRGVGASPPPSGVAILPRDEILEPEGVLRSIREDVEPLVRARGLSWEQLGSFFKLRHELFELDVRFSEVGERGLFRLLADAGALDHRVDGMRAVEEAMVEPPEGSRALLRGRLVRRLADEPGRYRCAWHGVWDLEANRIASLRNPFQKKELWRKARTTTLASSSGVFRFPES